MFRAEPSFDFKGVIQKANRSRIDSFTGIGDEGIGSSREVLRSAQFR